MLQYADSRALRELMYREYVTRAAEFGKAEWDNTPLIGEILELRREMAQLLGFCSYAEYSLTAKMADTPQQVLQFLSELAARAKPYARRDLEEVLNDPGMKVKVEYKTSTGGKWEDPTWSSPSPAGLCTKGASYTVTVN